ncbi:hypothetical protein [Brachybacterium paraconglomeratum]|uniref:hypothetical protein n=1 Tax=Brachybacterium paraconglomeratum TaxID=173362 RepID=UPI00026C6904|nr:hypothetical protein [Brachybacterium paraconglomeratum]
MTTLYRPVLIESAEQAEALPVGTVATTADVYQVSRKIEDDGAWHRPDLIDDLGWDEDMVGWSALVPIEAEEEWDVVGDAAVGRRLVTPWEEA